MVEINGLGRFGKNVAEDALAVGQDEFACVRACRAAETIAIGG